MSINSVMLVSCLFIYLYLYTSIFVYLSICLSVYLSICLSVYLSTYRSIYTCILLYVGLLLPVLLRGAGHVGGPVGPHHLDTT